MKKCMSEMFDKKKKVVQNGDLLQPIHCNASSSLRSGLDIENHWLSNALDRLTDDEACVCERIERLEELLLKLKQDREAFMKNANKVEQDITIRADQFQLRIENDKNQLLDEVRRTEETCRAVYEKSRQEIERSVARMKEFQIASAKIKNEPVGDAVVMDALHNERNELDAIRHKIVLASLRFTPSDVNLSASSMQKEDNVIGSVAFYKEIDVLDRYMTSPVLLQIVPGTVSILGLAMLNSELFVLRCASVEAAAHVEVYSMPLFDTSLSTTSSQTTLTSSFEYTVDRCLSICSLRDPKDIVGNRDVLYVSDFSGRVLVLDTSGKLLSLWDVGGQSRGLSMTSSGHLLVTCSKTRMIKEYSLEGKCLSSISLQQDIVNPLHAIQLDSGLYAVCHGWTDNSVHRVCLVDSSGKLIHAYGGPKGPGPGHVDLPFRLAVDQNKNVLVIDRNNHRIQELSPKMTHVRDLLSREEHQLEAPRRFMLSAQTGILYVGLNDGRVLIYKIMNL